MYYDPYHLDNQPQADSGQTEIYTTSGTQKEKAFLAQGGSP